MTKIFALLVLYLSVSFCFSQSISGKVVNESTQEPLAYVSIEIVNKNSGTVTSEDGSFKFNIASFSPQSKVRISMIGFEAQIIQLKDLINHENVIRLKELPVQLSEVIVRPQKQKHKTIGTKSSTTKTMTGWGGCGNCSENLGGIERGIQLDIDKTVFVEKVNFHIAYLGYDSMLLRLHIRKIENDNPGDELLKNNIYIRAKSEGWQEIDLRRYNLSFSADVAVSLEWVKAWGKVKGKENSMKLSVALFKGKLLAKDTHGGNWTISKHASPGIYLTVEYE